MQRVRTSFVAALLAAAAAVAYAQAPARPTPGKAGAPKTAASAHVMANVSDMKWGPGPDSLPPGAQLAVVEGDPSKAAPFVIRAKFPDGYKVPPHWHPTDEAVTVISGTLMAAMGEKWDDAATKALETGGFALMPKKTAHYVMAKGETVVQLNAMGPFVVNYINPNDDPRKKKTQ